MNNYMVYYVEGCSPKIAHFKSKKVAQAFVDKFIDTYGTGNDDYWVDSIVEGKIIKSYEGLDGVDQVRPKKIAAYFAKAILVAFLTIGLVTSCAPFNPNAPRKERDFRDK